MLVQLEWQDAVVPPRPLRPELGLAGVLYEMRAGATNGEIIEVIGVESGHWAPVSSPRQSASMT